jgi:hypothetical protein
VNEKKSPPFDIDPSVQWPLDAPAEVRAIVEDVVAWRVRHRADWYFRPGRTLHLVTEGGSVLKIKGAGCYNPPGASFSGLKRTKSPVPESSDPMPPLESEFKRDLIHVDPAERSPYELESVQSMPAPVGGMTIDAAVNDQLVFAALQAAEVPSNAPVTCIRYRDLNLNGRPLAASVSLLPRRSLPFTPYEIYCGWLTALATDDLERYVRSNTGTGRALSEPEHRLELVAQLSQRAGELIAEFSLSAGLYRFSGSPDNWNMREEADSPLYFSDVDTARFLKAVPERQRPWEVLRNLLTAIHQWTYFFIPSLTYAESGYSYELIREFDFIRPMIEGFFPDARQADVSSAVSQIWELLEPVFVSLRLEREPLGLRGGEYFLQAIYPRPTFYLLVLAALAPLVQRSQVAAAYPDTDTTVSGIRSYIRASASNASHRTVWPSFFEDEIMRRIDSVIGQEVAPDELGRELLH